MNNQKIINSVLAWRLRNISNKQFILFLSFIVGIFSGIAAVILKNTIHFTQSVLTDWFNKELESYWYLAYPALGVFISLLFVKYIIKDNLSHGITRVLHSISQRSSVLRPHNTYSSIVASTFTIGLGGSVGAEAPIVLTGASIGSNLGRLFRMNYRNMTLLIGCGASGAIAGIFNAPIAGIIFTLEVLMLDLTLGSIIPLLISSVTSAVIAYFLMGNEVLFNFNIIDVFALNTIPFYILLGIFAGFISLYFTRMTLKIEAEFQKIENTFKKFIIGGLALSILIFIFPPLYGEGYESLRLILQGQGDNLVNSSYFYLFRNDYWLFAVFLGLLLFFKVTAMAFTTGAGGVGGIFAPSLFMGGISGFLLARIINGLNIGIVPESHFVLAGMAGVISGVMHAPLMAIFLIAEITGGYELFIPLIIVATIAYITIIYFEPHSVYTKRLAAKGQLITHDKDKAVLSIMKVGNLIETNFSTIHSDFSLRKFVKVVSSSSRNVFPVVDDENNFQGVVFINDVRNIIFENELYDKLYVRDMMFMPDVEVDPDESMEDVAQKFMKTQHYNLPVIKNGKYIGFVSRANVFSQYRKLLKDFSTY